MLAPVEERFGELKREQAANALLLSAQLSMKQDQIRTTRDDEVRVELAAQITELKKDLKRQRREVGIYVMSYVRSIMPKTTWSLWARLGQSLAEREKAPAAGASLWDLLQTKLLRHNVSGESLHSRIDAALVLRARATALTTEGDG